MNGQTFLGIGHNPDGPDLPLGLGMRLEEESRAKEAFEMMSNDQKAKMIGYIQGAVTGDEAKGRISDVIAKLKIGQTRF